MRQPASCTLATNSSVRSNILGMVTSWGSARHQRRFEAKSSPDTAATTKALSSSSVGCRAGARDGVSPHFGPLSLTSAGGTSANLPKNLFQSRQLRAGHFDLKCWLIRGCVVHAGRWQRRWLLTFI